MPVFRSYPQPRQAPSRVAVLFPASAPEDPPRRAPLGQPVVAAHWLPARALPPRTLIAAFGYTGAPAVEDPPLRAPMAQQLAAAAYRLPTPRLPILPNAAVLDYYETEVSIGQDGIQNMALAAYRPAPRLPPQPRPGLLVFTVGPASVVGTGALVLPAITAAGTGVAAHVGLGALIVPTPTSVGTGISSHPGSGALVIPLPTLAGSGSAAGAGSIVGTGALLLPLPTLAGVGIASHKGVGALIVPIPTLVGIGRDTSIRGTGALVLPGIIFVGTGVNSHPVTGSNKNIIAFTTTGQTIYTVVRRAADGYFLNDADGAFAAAPVDTYIALTEHPTIKGLYTVAENRTVWDDGAYDVLIYSQVGGSPAPGVDTVIGSRPLIISNDSEVIGGDIASVLAVSTGAFNLARQNTAVMESKLKELQDKMRLLVTAVEKQARIKV